MVPERADDGIKFLHAYWLSKRRPSGLPAKRDIDPADFARLLPFVFLIEGDHPDRMRMRLVGTGFWHYFGCEVTGRPVAEVLPTDAGLEDHRQCYETRQPVYRSGPRMWPRAGMAVEVERILLPLGDDGGVTHVLGYIKFWYQNGQPIFR